VISSTKAYGKPANKNPVSLLMIFFGLIILGITIWLYINLDYQTIEKDLGYQDEALTNDYLAAEYFLRSMGNKSEEIELFKPNNRPLTKYDTLLITTHRQAFDVNRSKKLLDWVELGGHLIISAQISGGAKIKFRDHVLDKLGLFIEQKDLKENSIQGEEPVNVDIDDADFWQVDFNDFNVIQKTDQFNAKINWQIEDEGRVHGVQITLGEGKLTILSDLNIFNNDFIEDYDHAVFLYLLANDPLLSKQSGVFYYSLYEKNISLLGWLWRNAPLLLISLLCLVGFILWMLVPRFGPVINIKQPVRRNFSEHLFAAGHYHWNFKYYNRLLNDVRKQLSYRVQLKYPEWSRANQQDQVMHFSDLSHLEPLLIKQALFDSDIKKESDFINKIKILEKLRKSL